MNAGGWDRRYSLLREEYKEGLALEAIGPYFRQWRNAQNLSCQEVALACDVAIDVVTQWDDDPSCMPLMAAKHLADTWHWPSINQFFTLPPHFLAPTPVQRLANSWTTHMGGQLSSIHLNGHNACMVLGRR